MKTGKHDIIEFVKRSQHGDEQAMSELITMLKGLVYTIIFRMVNDPELSKDLTQDTFIRFFLKLDKIKYPEQTRAWICKMARNIVYDYYRKAKKHKTVSFEEISEPKGVSGLEKMHKKMIIHDALARLSERDQMLLAMAYYEGFSLSEVGDVMKIPEKNVKVYLHRARLRLRKELEGRKNELLSTR